MINEMMFLCYLPKRSSGGPGAADNALNIVIGNWHLHSTEEDNLSLLWIRKSLACARASKLKTTNCYIATARCESQPAVKSSGLDARSS